MSIPVACKCGQQFMAQPHLAGKQVACPSCGSSLVIPATDDKPAVSESDPVENVVSCQCGQSFKAAAHLLGKRVSCPSCGRPIDIPGGQNRASSTSQPAAPSPAPKAKQAARSPKAPASKQHSPTLGPKAAPSLADGTSETDVDMDWDDALAMPAGAAPLDALGTGPAYANRRTAPEPIEPMTMYAIWIGGGAVVLLILVILGHITWNAFAARERPVPAEPAQTEEELESPPVPPEAEPVSASPPPTKETSEIASDVWRADAEAIKQLQPDDVELFGLSYRPPKDFEQIASGHSSHGWAFGLGHERSSIVAIIPGRGTTQGEELRQQVFAGLDRRPKQMEQEYSNMVHEPFEYGRLASGLHVARMNFTARPQVQGQTLDVIGRYYVVMGEDAYLELVLTELGGNRDRLATMEATALTIRTP